MKLRAKMGLLFAAAFIINVAVLSFGLVNVLDRVSSKLMLKEAEDITLLVQHEIIDASYKTGSLDYDAAQASFQRLMHVSQQGGSFEISKILLIDQNLAAVVAYPESETGIDYSSHTDIKESIEGKKQLVAEEAAFTQTGVLQHEIDVVSYFELSSGTGYALEVKLDFARSIALLEKQYAVIETTAVIIALVLLAALLGTLLLMVTRSAVRPVIEITQAMERVGAGYLEETQIHTGKDEFSLMALRFNEMVVGLKEKLKLSQYVSRSTVAAVKDSIGSSDSGHTVSRRRCTLFFSDIRGFTTYSESRDPAQVVSTLNKVLSLQAEIVRRAGGDVDKFVGDEVMAVFNEVLPALEAAFEIQKLMASQRSELDNLAIGIGIHEGDVVQGDVGSEDIRNFTVIGDAVNTAARLESQARAGEILISESAIQQPETRALFSFKPRGELKLKGKEIPIRTFTVKGRKRT
jgi:adenylate cyclase